MIKTRSAWLVVLLLVGGCEDWEKLAQNAKVDAGLDAGEGGVGTDAGRFRLDGGLDAGGEDAGVDAGLDAGTPPRCLLSALTVSGGTLTPPLSDAVSMYQVRVPYSVTSFVVHAELASPDAGITLDGAGGFNAAGDSAPIPLSVGTTTVTLQLKGGPCPSPFGVTYSVAVTSRNALDGSVELSIDAGAIDDATLGQSIAVSGDRVLLGAPREDTLVADGGLAFLPDGGALRRSGRAYLFERLPGGWARVETFTPPAPHRLGEFGTSVALAGDLAAIAEPEFGLVHVYRRLTGGWVFQGSVTGHNTASTDGFGSALALAAGQLVVGAPLEDNYAGGIDVMTDNESGNNAGAVYVFAATAADGGWVERGYLKPDMPSPSAQFGAALAFDGTRLVVGAPGEATNAVGVNPMRPSMAPAQAESGAIFIYARSGASWSQEAWAKAPNAGEQDRFGAAVALSGGRVVIGAPMEASSDRLSPAGNGMPMAGAAYVMTLDGGWRFTDYLKATTPAMGDRFGDAVGISGDVIAVGGPEHSDLANARPMVGAAWVFSTTDGTHWEDRGKWLGPRAEASQRFGAPLVVGPSSIFLCAPAASPMTQGACWETVYQAP